MLGTPELDVILHSPLSREEWKNRIPSLNLLATLLWMQSRIWLVFWKHTLLTEALFPSVRDSTTPKTKLEDGPAKGLPT